MEWSTFWIAGLESRAVHEEIEQRFAGPEQLFEAWKQGNLPDELARRVRGYVCQERVGALARTAEDAVRRLGFGAPHLLPTRSLPSPLGEGMTGLWAACAGSPSVVDGEGVAIVGSRAIDAAQRRRAEWVVQQVLDVFPGAVVSGGAHGVDTVVHRAALARDRPAILFLAGGLARCGPVPNRRDFVEVSKRGGCVVTERPPLAEPQRYEFIRRNQHIAAASRAVIVVHASATSGALETARAAQRLGRPVLAVPGRPEDALSVGCNEILRSGGRVFLDGSDLLDALSENAAAGPARVARSRVPRRAPATESAPAWTPVPSEIRARSPAEIDRVLRFVERASTAPSTDEIVRACALPAPRLHAYLFQLELAGCLRNELGGRWRRA